MMKGNPDSSSKFPFITTNDHPPPSPSMQIPIKIVSLTEIDAISSLVAQKATKLPVSINSEEGKPSSLLKS